MCELDLVKVLCVTVKLLTIISKNSDVIEYKIKHTINPKQLFSKLVL